MNPPPAIISVIVRTCNRQGLLRRLVTSIDRETHFPWRAFVVDGGSTDGTVEWLRNPIDPRVVSPFNGAGLSLAATYNRVLQQVDTPYVCWLGDDHEVASHGLDAAVKIMEADPAIALVGMQTRAENRARGLSPVLGGVSPLGILTTAHGLVRTRELRAVGGFSEWMQNHHLDADLTTKILLHGGDVVLSRAVTLRRHLPAPPSGGTSPLEPDALEEREAHARYLHKFATEFRPDPAWERKKATWKRWTERFPTLRDIDGTSRVHGLLPREWQNLMTARFTSLREVRRPHAMYHLRQHLPEFLRPVALPPENGRPAPAAPSGAAGGTPAPACHLVYDHQMFSLQTYGGITRIFIELMRRLPSVPDLAVSWYRGFHIDEYRVGPLTGGLRRYQAFAADGAALTGPARTALNWEGLRQFLRTFDRERLIFHPTYFDAAVLEFVQDRPLVITVADLIAERYLAGIDRFRQHLTDRRQLIERADLILVISEHTRKDLIEIHGVPPERIQITPLASDFDTLTSAPFPAELARRKRPYFLYVGTRSKYKNFDLLMQAFALDPRLRERFDVVSFGGSNGFLEHEHKFFAQHGLADNFVYLRGNDRLLHALYERAVGLIYTSRYEGFGLPPLEAMHCRCPVVCCPVASLPEVVGDAFVPIDADQPESVVAAMLRVADDTSLRSRLITQGLVQAARFSWDRTAALTARAYRSLGT